VTFLVERLGWLTTASPRFWGELDREVSFLLALASPPNFRNRGGVVGKKIRSAWRKRRMDSKKFGNSFTWGEYLAAMGDIKGQAKKGNWRERDLSKKAAA